ncbi:MAG: Ig domain-containing protein, partial [Erysipelotrichaceae bacterium]|nr:Ig domain-containing protein [Erysipelotrichaceae bacterium]
MKKTLTAVMIMALALSLFGCKPKDIPVSGIDLEETEVEFTELGETCQIAASVKPDDATDKTITYTSNNPEVCTVSSTGVVTATGKGEATVTVKSGDVSAEFKVIVSVRNVIAVYYNLVKDVLEQY